MWSGLIIQISQDNPKVNLRVTDDLGNEMNQTVQTLLKFDAVNPVIQSIRTERQDETGKYWLGAGTNTIYVDVLEMESGLDNRNILIDVGSLGTQETSVGPKTVLLPNNCTQGWTCVYRNIFVDQTLGYESGTGLNVPIVFGSSDDAGNGVLGVERLVAGYDNVPPEILNIVNSSICPAAPDTIEYTVNVSDKDSGYPKVIVSAPKLSTTFFPTEFECVKTEEKGIWECPVEIDNLITLYAKGEVNLTIEDLAGNQKNTINCKKNKSFYPDVHFR